MADAAAVAARRLGRLGAEERAARLCDPGTFARAGGALRSRGAAPAGDGIVVGVGVVAGRPLTVIASDGRVLRGTLGAAEPELATRALEAARRAGQPVVLLLDSDGARQSEGAAALLANTRFLAALADAGGHVPRLGALFGAAGGSAAYALALCDLSVAVTDRSFAFVAGPAVVQQALGEESSLETLGGTALHLGNGLLHAAVADDAAALGWLRAALGYLPGSAAAVAPWAEAREPRRAGGLADSMPAGPKAGWDLQRALDGLLDDGVWLELGAQWGPSVRTGLTRLGGRALMLVASSADDGAGAIDSAAARKVARFVRLASAFNLPLLTLADTPGFLPGRQAEAAAILCHGAAVIAAYCEARRAVPRVAVIVRRAIGAGSVLVAEADVVLALPGATLTQMGGDAMRAAAAASGVAAHDEALSPEEAGLAERTVAPVALRGELVRAFERLPAARPMAAGTRRTALFPL